MSEPVSLSPFKPVYALADSQLLFWKRPDGSLFLSQIAEATGSARPSVAYIGASNDDSLEVYHTIFESAIEQIPTGERRMILKRPSASDAAFLERADLIVLAGGNVEAGWRVFAENGLAQLIPRRFSEGAVLVGISAGAVQLGRGGLTDDGTALLPTFGLLPFYVGAHDEKCDWASLRKVLHLADGPCRGFGLPFGSGLVYQSGELDPVRKPIIELFRDNDCTQESLAVPAAP